MRLLIACTKGKWTAVSFIKKISLLIKFFTLFADNDLKMFLETFKMNSEPRKKMSYFLFF